MRVKRLNRTANSVSPSALLSPAKHAGRVPPADGKVYAGKREKKKAKYNNAAASPRPCEANKSQSDGASHAFPPSAAGGRALQMVWIYMRDAR